MKLRRFASLGLFLLIFAARASADNVRAEIRDTNAVFGNWQLNNYFKDAKKKDTPIDLNSVTNHEGQVLIAFDSPELAYLDTAKGNLVTKGNTSDWSFDDSKVTINRKVVFPEGKPYAEVFFTAKFKGEAPKFAFISLFAAGLNKDPEEQDRQVAYFSNKDIKRYLLNSKIDLEAVSFPVKWVSAMSRYFILAAVPASDSVLPNGLVQPAGPGGGRISLVYAMNGNSIEIPLKVYFGPKDLALLHAVEPTLDNAVDFGWFTVLAYPLLRLLRWFYQYFHNYGVAIIMLTIVVKVVTYPLTYKSMKSMKKMAVLQPQIKKLQEKYKNDRAKLNQEMMQFMKSHGYNPAAGCWPIAIQMPVFFALYRVLYSAVELYQAPFAFWLYDLSAKDPYYVTPILVGITWFLQQKLSPQTITDPMQRKMMQFMPLIFTFMMLTLPSGLGIYFFVNALLSIAQQLIMNKKLDTGHVPAVAAG